ncbi:unnamed protein product [Rotaria magnacalcarata]|uniref:Uncharacterized protein n=1 Tax=Rotaria magnacalcarata TaxID=392030 RepID=A0A815ZII2_9BILA|nr:unnamed protein product [Rotaria magnacalcarata]CAF4746735.1 unnamed protein product [Rotaria magnacalcarata]
MQAWDGGGTGAWYRVDSSCLYSFSSTTLIQCLPTIIIPTNETLITDGFFISLGVFNRLNGAGLDIGLTCVPQTDKWWSYANDALGWKSGNISISSSTNRCINISLSISNGCVKYFIRTNNGSIILGQDLYTASQLDPQLNLTVNSSNFGFYRFDSIAQTKETLKSGSSMIHAQLVEWLLELESHVFVPARGDFMASSIRGYPPGPCCTSDEINAIHTYNETKWNQADISIVYH